MPGRTIPDPGRASALLAEHSPPLAMAMDRRYDVRDRLITKGGWTRPVEVADWMPDPHPNGCAFRSEAELATALRLAKEGVFVHLAMRDLAGLADLKEVTWTLSRLARLCLGRALDFGLLKLADRFGLPAWPSGRPGFFCVLGMGKLGAGELNYSSDIDLIHIYDSELWPHPGRLSAAEAAVWLAALIGRLIGRVTAEGLVFRVDTDLRPAGKDGPLAINLEAARHHYLYRAAEWERLALIKMASLAGNLELGRELISETRPFVFRRHLDYTALDELADLKAKIAARPRSLTQKGFDLKLDRGGIRQLEFFVQTLQLIFGGRNPALRRPATLDALTDLAGQEIITAADRTDLARAYDFLRRAEHRVQLLGLTQTQALPANRAGLDRLGRAMGCGGADPGRDLMDDLEHHAARVSIHFESLLGGAAPTSDARPLQGLLEAMDQGDEELCLDLLAMSGFHEPDRALETITRLTSDAFLPHSLGRQRRLLGQVVPATLDRVLASVDPDSALLRLTELFARIGPKTGLFMLLRENPAVMDLLVTVMASSAYLARTLNAHPGLLDSLIDSRNQGPRDAAEMGAELDLLLGAAADDEERVGLIRRFKAEETLRIAVSDLIDRLPVERVSDRLSDLADVVLTRTLGLAAGILAYRYREVDWTLPRFAVLALGKHGGRELAYHSDLDVIFLHQPVDEADAPLAGEYAAKLAQRVINLLSTSLVEGPGYELDARLRPSGRQGPLVVSLESFARYHQTSQTWERLALTKARPVAGDPELMAAAGRAAVEAVFGAPLPEGWAGEVMELRGRMARERGASRGWDIKFGPGGLIDIEFAAEALQLNHGRNETGLRTPHILRGLKAQRKAGLLNDDSFQALHQGYRYLRGLDLRLRLLYDRSGDRVGYSDQEVVRAGADTAQLGRVMDAAARAAQGVMEEL